MFKKLMHSIKTKIALIAALIVLSGCTGVGSIDSAQSLGLGLPPETAFAEKFPAPVVPDSKVDEVPETPAVRANPDLYTDMPTGPNNTGQYPQMSVAPESRIGPIEQDKVNATISQLQALNTARAAGSISAEAYAKRLAELQKLATNHSPEMLKRIEANRE